MDMDRLKQPLNAATVLEKGEEATWEEITRRIDALLPDEKAVVSYRRHTLAVARIGPCAYIGAVDGPACTQIDMSQTAEGLTTSLKAHVDKALADTKPAGYHSWAAYYDACDRINETEMWRGQGRPRGVVL